MNQTLRIAAIALAANYGANATYRFLSDRGGIPALRIDPAEFFPLLFTLVMLSCLLP